MNIRFWGLLALGTLLMASCKDEGQELIKRFKNQSDATLEITLINNYLDFTQTLTVGPGESSDLSTGSNDGKDFENYSCLWEVDDLQIQVSGNRTLLKDPLDESNWIYEVRGEESDLTRLCIFLVQQSDIQ